MTWNIFTLVCRGCSMNGIITSNCKWLLQAEWTEVWQGDIWQFPRWAVTLPSRPLDPPPPVITSSIPTTTFIDNKSTIILSLSFIIPNTQDNSAWKKDSDGLLALIRPEVTLFLSTLVFPFLLQTTHYHHNKLLLTRAPLPPLSTTINWRLYLSTSSTTVYPGTHCHHYLPSVTHHQHHHFSLPHPTRLLNLLSPHLPSHHFSHYPLLHGHPSASTTSQLPFPLCWISPSAISSPWFPSVIMWGETPWLLAGNPLRRRHALTYNAQINIFIVLA